MASNLEKASAITGIILGIFGLIFGFNQWRLNTIQEKNMNNEEIRIEYEKIILMIESGKECKEYLAEKASNQEYITTLEKYNCFKIDSIFCTKLDHFIAEYETTETLSAIEYYISYYDNKKFTDLHYRNQYLDEISKLKIRKQEVLKAISLNQN
jgi:hypothetical protein